MAKLKAFPGYNPWTVHTTALAELARVVKPLKAQELNWEEWVALVEPNGIESRDVFAWAARDSWFRELGWRLGLSDQGGHFVPAIQGISRPGRHPARAIALFFFPGIHGFEHLGHSILNQINHPEGYPWLDEEEIDGVQVAKQIQRLLAAVWLDSWVKAFSEVEGGDH